MNCVEYTNFLDEKLNVDIYDYTLKIADKFSNSTVINYSDRYEDWRKSKVVFHSDFKHYYRILSAKIMNELDVVCDRLNIEKFLVDNLQIQLTAHNDGEYFKEHSDNSGDLVKNRVISFVYYFHAMPKKFDGGQLVLLEGINHVIEPDNNKLVFFNSSIRHEVKPVKCSSKDFKDSRFTLNGWIIRKTE